MSDFQGNFEQTYTSAIGIAGTTPSLSRPYVDRGQTPSITKNSIQREFGPTGTAIYSIVRTPPGTATINDSEKAHKNFVKVEAAPDMVERDRDNRISLLIQKFEGHSSREDSARLDILTQRIRSISPRVSRVEISNLGSVVEQVETISDRLAELESELDLL